MCQPLPKSMLASVGATFIATTCFTFTQQKRAGKNLTIAASSYVLENGLYH